MKTRTLWVFTVVLSWILLLCCLTGCGHSHSFSDWETVQKASCTQDGRMKRKCECGETEVIELSKRGHTYQDAVTTEANCSESGVITYTCLNCNDSYTETFDPTVYSATQIHDMYLNSVGEIVVYDRKGAELGLGSCFVYTEDGQLITNYHVIEGAYSAKVTLEDKTYTVQKVLAYDKEIDVAILEISKSGLTPVQLCDKDHKVGETVYAFGNSRGLTSTFSDGMITYSCREVDGVNYVQHDAPISGGNSGGPLINKYGEVIGINTWTVLDSQNLNFAIHITELGNVTSQTPMTMAEFYQKECNAYKMIKDHTVANGLLDDGMYFLALHEYTDEDGDYYSIDILYDTEDDSVLVFMSYNTEFYVYFQLDDAVSGVYEWYYFDDYNNDMSGTLVAGTFDGEKNLSYSYSNISGDAQDTIAVLSTAMMLYLCQNMDDAFADIGLTARDLGFRQF